MDIELLTGYSGCLVVIVGEAGTLHINLTSASCCKFLLG